MKQFFDNLAAKIRNIYKGLTPDYVKATAKKNRMLYIRKGASSDTEASLQLAGAISKETLNHNVALFLKKVNAFRLQNNIDYKLPVGEDTSPRALLANALEGAAQTEKEIEKIREYKDQISVIEAEEQKLRELRGKIKELSFAKGPRDTKVIKELRLEANKTANRINIYDKQLLRLEAAKPLQDVLAREKERVRKREERKRNEALEAYREEAARNQRELTDRWKESRKKAIEGREKTAMRHKIQNVVKELNSLLLTNDKKRHVPESLKKAVAEALDLVNMDTVGAEERAAKYAALIARKTDPDKAFHFFWME